MKSEKLDRGGCGWLLLLRPIYGTAAAASMHIYGKAAVDILNLNQL